MNLKQEYRSLPFFAMEPNFLPVDWDFEASQSRDKVDGFLKIKALFLQDSWNKIKQGSIRVVTHYT